MSNAASASLHSGTSSRAGRAVPAVRRRRRGRGRARGRQRGARAGDDALGDRARRAPAPRRERRARTARVPRAPASYGLGARGIRGRHRARGRRRVERRRDLGGRAARRRGSRGARTCARRRRRRLRGEATPLAAARDYLTLTKPRIMTLLLLTGAAGMFVGAQGVPPLGLFAVTMLGLALACGGASALNHVLDRDIDALMGIADRATPGRDRARDARAGARVRDRALARSRSRSWPRPSTC